MKKLHSLLLASLVMLAGCGEINDRLDALEGRVDAIENTQIATISQQITSINNSILLLNSTDKELGEYIAALEAEAENLQTQITATNTKIDEVKAEILATVSSEKANILAELEAFKATVNGELEAIKAVLETLKAKDAELDGKIDTLQEYVDKELKATEDWATATFATLEQYNEVVATIATIEGAIEGLNESISALETRINEKIAKDIETACATLSADLQNAVKEVTEAYTSAIATAKNELTEAYTTALEGAISALETSMKAWVNEQLASYYTIAEMDAKLQVMQTALESKITASEDYLKGLISDLESAINEKIAENSKLIATLSASLSALESTLADRAQDIIANTQAIEANAQSIKENAEKILANGENIQANTTLIAENKTLIAQNEQLIKSNQSAIAALQNGVSANSQTIATNATNIATNASDIANNAAHIANNASAIADNLAAIATNATNLAKLQSELEATANEITEAYTNAIATAIATNKGEIEAKIATEIQKVNDKINALTQRVSALEQTVSNISTRLEDVESDIVDIQEQLTSLVNRIQSISYIPQYSDGKATIDTDKKIGVFDFHISPKSALSDLARVWHSALSVKAVHTQTRSTALIELPITYFKANTTEGTFSIQIDATNLGDDFFVGNREASVALHLSDGDNEYISSYINLALGVVEGIENAPANNEIWYTSTDGEIVTPCNGEAFGANIVSNTYKDGKGVITFDGDVSEIGDGAFYECATLGSIDLPKSATSIGDWAFHLCKSLTNITIPFGVVSIGEAAFDLCSNLPSINIPSSVVSIGVDAFENCQALTDVYISDIAAWCNVDFDTLTSNPLFYATRLYLNNELVTDLVIPDGVSTIKSLVFQGECLTSISLPESIMSVALGAFSWCYNVNNVYIAHTEVIPFVGRSNYNLWCNGELVTEYRFPDETTNIDNRLSGCKSIQKVIIPDGAQSIDKSAFSQCSNLSQIVIPDGVSTIGDNAFLNCSGLKNITIGAGVTSISPSSFNGCVSLEYIEVVDNRIYDSRGYCNAIIETATNTLIMGCKTTTIPNTINVIGNYAFSDCVGLTDVTIPNSVSTIGRQAFTDCTSLTSVTVGKGVTSIGNLAFVGCKNLAEVHISDLAAWCNTVMHGTIWECAYNLYLNDNLVVDLVIPNEVTTIGSGVFEDCTSLQTVHMGQNVSTIEGFAFYDCSNLRSVTIGQGIKSIQWAAFSNCRNIKEVYCMAITPPAIYVGSSSSIDENSLPYNLNMVIYVPRDSYNDYTQTTMVYGEDSPSNWCYYKSIIKPYDFE